jgi:uncharacterized protein (DUF1330 family)
MEYIEPDQRVVEDFIAQFPSETPVVMLNLLKFNSQANYLAGQDAEPCNGFEAFMRYGIAVTPMIEAAGGEQVWQGRPASMLIGPQDKEWNLAVLVRYPSAQAFVDMVSSPEYRAISFHRSAALEDSRLIASEEL